MSLESIINFDQQIIRLQVRKLDVQGRSTGRADIVAYRFEPVKMINAFTVMYKSGGTQRVDKCLFTAKEGCIVVTTSQGVQVIPGDPKKLIQDFLKVIGKEPEVKKPAPKKRAGRPKKTTPAA